MLFFSWYKHNKGIYVYNYLYIYIYIYICMHLYLLTDLLVLYGGRKDLSGKLPRRFPNLNTRTRINAI